MFKFCRLNLLDEEIGCWVSIIFVSEGRLDAEICFLEITVPGCLILGLQRFKSVLGGIFETPPPLYFVFLESVGFSF